MKLHVKLIWLASRTVPTLNDGGEGTIETDDGATLADVLDGLGLPGDESYAALVNGTVIPPGERGAHRMGERDSLTVFPPIKGG